MNACASVRVSVCMCVCVRLCTQQPTEQTKAKKTSYHGVALVGEPDFRAVARAKGHTELRV
jgi:hypothetical protein